nr:MAG TPA: hypothetical protein [Caudoviricetes sp.]
MFLKDQSTYLKFIIVLGSLSLYLCNVSLQR